MRVLLVEDQADLRCSLGTGLRAEGYAVDAAADGEEAWYYLHDGAYDLVILDRLLPELDGLSLLRRLRATGSSVPVLLLTALDAVADRVAGLDAGADDYLVKPFHVPELLARMRSLVRRHYGGSEPVLRCGRLTLDPAAKRVTWDDQALDLTAREFALLEMLLHQAGDVVSRSELWEQLYDFASSSTSNVLDVLVARLRKKLQAAGAPPLIHTRRGQGYLLQEAAP